MSNTSGAFLRDGYTIVRGALDGELCRSYAEQIITEYQSLVSSGWQFSGSGALSGHLNIRQGEPGCRLYRALRDAGIEELVATLAGEGPQLMQAVGNLNLPGSCAQDFHMDGGFERPILIANVCLVPTGTDNGATELVPGSHRQHLSYWRFARDGWRERAMAVETQPGDVLIRLSTLWHRGTPNRSARARPMAAFGYAPRALAEPDGPCTDLDGPLRIFANKYYGRMRKMKEFVAARLPLVDEVLRQGRSLVSERQLHAGRDA